VKRVRVRWCGGIRRMEWRCDGGNVVEVG